MPDSTDHFLQRAIHQEVAIVPYQSNWPADFEREKARLLAISPKILAVEHIGSTAVPALAAKPVIDLLAGVASMAVADELLPLLCRNGYVTSAEFNATLKDHRWLMRHDRGHRTHHLHLMVLNGPAWNDRLKFRDALRAKPKLAKEYLSLKKKLAAEHGADRELYSTSKTEFIERVLAGGV